MSLDYFQGVAYAIRTWMRAAQAEITNGVRHGARRLGDTPDIASSRPGCAAAVGWPTPDVPALNARSNTHKQ